MRILGSLTVIALAIASRIAGAQLTETGLPRAMFGLTGGLNLTTFAGDGLGPTENRHGFVGGAMLTTPFTPVFSTQLELLYAMKGMKSLSSNPATYAMFKLNYLEVPLMLRADAPMSTSVKPFAFTGPAFDFKVSCGGDGVANGVTTSFSCDDLKSGSGGAVTSRTFDVGWVLGGGLGFPFHNRRISLSARYELGLRTISENGSSKNRALSFMASIEAPLPRKTRPAGGR
jgi:hypothetical protein